KFSFCYIISVFTPSDYFLPTLGHCIIANAPTRNS
ncbi:aminopeptidase, partial [Escherichia coli]|nr:aminopeptidase [Escherichia coli]